MPTYADLLELYGVARASILARHLAFGRHFRANWPAPVNYLGTRDRPFQERNPPRPPIPPEGERVPVEKYTPEARWSIGVRDRENPCLDFGQLMTCLAIEHALGNAGALPIIRRSLDALEALFKFKGNDFDGYFLRYDPVTCDHWQVDGNGNPTLCNNFLVGPDGQYMYCSPRHDPRYSTEAATYGRYSYLQWEPSMDELCGVVLGHAMIHDLVADDATRAQVRSQAEKIARYLAAHAYLLVRPGGGFTFRGATGILPLFSFPFGRVFERITGDAHRPLVSFEAAAAKAGFPWSHVLAEMDHAAQAATVPFELAETLNALARKLVGAKGPDAVQAVLHGAANGAADLARAGVILAHADDFLLEESEKTGVAGAYLLSKLDAKPWFLAWMREGNRFSDSYATWLVRWLALAGLDDPDPSVRNAYPAYLQNLRGRNPPEKIAATAIGAVLGSRDDEGLLAAWLDGQCARFRDPHALNHDLELSVNAGWPTEAVPSAVIESSSRDLMFCVALAWLTASRQGVRGPGSKTAGGLPGAPDLRAQPLPPVVVPAAVRLAAARGSGVVLPRDAGLPPLSKGPVDAVIPFDERSRRAASPPPPPFRKLPAPRTHRLRVDAPKWDWRDNEKFTWWLPPTPLTDQDPAGLTLGITLSPDLSRFPGVRRVTTAVHRFEPAVGGDTHRVRFQLTLDTRPWGPSGGFDAEVTVYWAPVQFEPAWLKTGFALPADVPPVLWGAPQLSVYAAGAERVQLSAYWADTPNVASTCRWHDLGVMEPQGDHFVRTIDTTEIPDQGNAGWGTVNLCATATYDGKACAPEDRLYRLVRIDQSAAPVQVAIQGPRVLGLGKSGHYRATVKGAADTAVSWRLDASDGRGTARADGSFDYFAPARPCTATLVAVSKADPRCFARFKVAVQDRHL